MNNKKIDVFLELTLETDELFVDVPSNSIQLETRALLFM